MYQGKLELKKVGIPYMLCSLSNGKKACVSGGTTKIILFYEEVVLRLRWVQIEHNNQNWRQAASDDERPAAASNAVINPNGLQFHEICLE